MDIKIIDLAGKLKNLELTPEKLEVVPELKAIIERLRTGTTGGDYESSYESGGGHDKTHDKGDGFSKSYGKT